MAIKKYRRLPQMTRKQLAAFWSKIDRRASNECWPWIAGKEKSGYGKFSMWPYGIFIATRVMYKLSKRRDPFPLNVLHRCDNPPCMNPAHLFRGTDQDNADDRTRKDRAYKVKVHEHARGERCRHAKLTATIVRKARRLRKKGFTYDQLVKHLRLDVSSHAIRDAVIGFTWKHVTG